MTDLIDTTEMYLRTIYELMEDGITPMRARIAEQLEHSGPTVSQTVARMQRDGLVVVSEGDHHLQLTPEGLAAATRVMRKHRLAERLLIDVIGLELPFVHDEACRWEHVMSERVEKRLLEILDSPDRSPYGNVIPGLEELGAAPATPTRGAIAVADVDGDATATLVRIGEGPQTVPGLLADIAAAGLIPGAAVRISTADGVSTVSSDIGSVEFDAVSARHIFVSLS